MALVNKTSVIKDSLRMLKKCPVSSGIGLFSYKRNRKVYLRKKETGQILLREEGYITEERIIETEKLEKELRTIVKREFPRSRKIRLYRMGEDELELSYQKI